MWFRSGLLLFVASIYAISGCNRGNESTAESTQVSKDDHGHSHAHSHGEGWWCAEHGVPEDICARCNISLVASFKEKRDWCEQHERPDSQCFICHPEKQTEFAAQYEAKFGKQPPPPDEGK